ncbi:MAG: flippase-like domain-containing protein, partial [Gemmatimonadetes bacterium]|nr:flippase-like domain-containing protein [Gemmatimonadota bacterium]
GLRTSGQDFRRVFGHIAREGKLLFAASTLLAALHWISRYSVVSALFAALDVPTRPVLFFLLQWVVFTCASFLPTPGGTGAAERAFYLVFRAFLPADRVALATAGWRFLTFDLPVALAAALLAGLRAGRLFPGRARTGSSRPASARELPAGSSPPPSRYPRSAPAGRSLPSWRRPWRLSPDGSCSARRSPAAARRWRPRGPSRRRVLRSRFGCR